MALMTDALSDAMNEDFSLAKILIYAIPVFICAYAFIHKNIPLFIVIALPTAILLLALLSNGIANVTSNKREILTFNIFSLISCTIKLFFAITPHTIISLFIGFCLTYFVHIPEDLKYGQIIYEWIVWTILASVILTAYIAFSKRLDVKAPYNMQILSESTMDILMNMIFLIPQLAIIDGILIGFVWYIFFFFKYPVQHPLFVYYCSVVLIFNISFLASYIAQISYEAIREKDELYNDNYYIKTKKSEFLNKKTKKEEKEKEN